MLAVRMASKLEKSKLGGVLGEGGVEVQHIIAAVVEMPVSAVADSVSLVSNV